MRRIGPSTSQFKVFLTSCEVGQGSWTTNEEKLRYAHELSDKKYALTEDPQSADIIIIGDVREEDWGKKILKHELINKYPDKSLSLSDADHLIIPSIASDLSLEYPRSARRRIVCPPASCYSTYIRGGRTPEADV